MSLPSSSSHNPNAPTSSNTALPASHPFSSAHTTSSSSSSSTFKTPIFHEQAYTPQSFSNSAVDLPQQQARKKLKHSEESAIPIYSSKSPLPPASEAFDFIQRSPSDLSSATAIDSTFDSDFSSTPIDLAHHHAQQHQQQRSSSEFQSPLTATSDLSRRVEHMFQEEQRHQPIAASASSSSTQHTSSAMSANASMSNSNHSSRSSSRDHSPVANGKESELLHATNNTSAQPAAKPNHTSKSTDPAGQTISEAELEGKFKVIRYLGKGSYGTVFVAEELATGKQVAIKKIPKCFDNLTNAKRLLREIKILRMLGHHNVIGYRGLLAPSIPATFNSLLIVFEFVDTDLAKLLASDQPITNQHVQYFLYQLLCGIHYIHSANIIHRDIKPANVLINADCSLKICDFGLSRSTLGPNPSAAAKKAAEDEQVANARKQAEALANAAPKLVQQRQVSTDKVSTLAQPQKLARELTKHVVTRWYRAPEVILLSDRYTTAIDMWSIGCIFSELLSMQTRTSRRALFPGRTCFPFSADNNPLAYTDQLDQLNVIFDVIGTPTKEEIEKIDNDRARSYLRSLPFKPKIDLPRRFAGADALAIDLLQKLLYFDPSKRFTARQALEHPYLAEFRQAEDEGVYQGGSVDFAFEDQPITKDQIKSLIVDQILIDNPQSKLSDFFPNGTTVGSAALSTQAAAAAAKEAAENHKRKVESSK